VAVAQASSSTKVGDLDFSFKANLARTKFEEGSIGDFKLASKVGNPDLLADIERIYPW
jgi:hypothetical protein